MIRVCSLTLLFTPERKKIGANRAKEKKDQHYREISWYSVHGNDNCATYVGSVTQKSGTLCLFGT